MIVSKDKNKLNKLHRNVEQIIYLSKYKSTKSFKILSESSSDILKVQSGHYLVYKHTLLGLLCKINIIFEILICNFFYPWGTEYFTRSCPEMPVHSRIKLELRNVGFFEERGKPEYLKKNLSEQRTNKLDPHVTPGPIIEPKTHWWEVQALITVPSPAPLFTVSRIVTLLIR